MVEPPEISCPVNMESTALAVRFQSTPGCSQNRLSSMATVASMRYWGISSMPTRMELVTLRRVVISLYSPVALSW